MRYLTILVLLFSVSSLRAQESQEITAVAYQTVNVRSGPGTQFEIIGQIGAEDVVRVTGRDSAMTRWLHITLPDDDLQGWVAYFTVTIEGDVQSLDILDGTTEPVDSEEPAPDEVSVRAIGRVNVRSGPGIEFEIINQLEAEATAIVVARNNYNNDWLYIENDTLVGWVAYFTVDVRGNADELPVLVPDNITGDLVPPSTLTRANFNVRLHTRPAFAAPVTGTVPFGTQVTPYGVTPDSQWVYIVHEDFRGWGWRRLFDLTDQQIATVPLRTPVPTDR